VYFRWTAASRALTSVHSSASMMRRSGRSIDMTSSAARARGRRLFVPGTLTQLALLEAPGAGVLLVVEIVFSTTLAAASWRNTRIERAFDPRSLAALKQGPGKGIICFGSGSIASQLAEHGLADEYHLVVSPLFLGGGRPLIAGLPRPVRLSLVEASALRSGNVSLRYEPAR
jgi:hypothetical protein